MNEIAELKHAGLKVTLPRLKILEILQSKIQTHFSAEDIYRVLLNERIDVGFATIYRVLGQLEVAKLVKRSIIQHGHAVYELDDGSHHDHILCLDCGKVDEFYDEEIEQRQAQMAARLGKEIGEHAMTLYCHCVKPDCLYKTNHGVVSQRISSREN